MDTSQFTSTKKRHQLLTSEKNQKMIYIYSTHIRHETFNSIRT